MRTVVSRRQARSDAVLAVTVTVFAAGVTGLFGDQFSPVDQPVDRWAVAMVAAAGLTLAASRRAPLPVLAVVAVLTAGYLLLGYPYGPVFLPLVVAVYTVGRHVPLRRALVACAAVLPLLLAHLATHPDALPGWLGVIPGSAWVAVPFVVGATMRMAREADDRARAEALRAGVMDERLRLAQEVHDVVGHGLAAIHMHADITLHVLAREPERARSALEAISRSSAEALEELRSTLQVVWRPEDTSAPTPGLGRVEELCARIRHAGVAVDLAVSGHRPADLAPAVDLAAYRIVQEALTNVVRHSPVPSARVAVRYEESGIELMVTNPGTGLRLLDVGFGLAGMRRRATALRGTFRAGPTAGGFEVAARLPAQAAGGGAG
jgi:signal transduction histidine kinase